MKLVMTALDPGAPNEADDAHAGASHVDATSVAPGVDIDASAQTADPDAGAPSADPDAGAPSADAIAQALLALARERRAGATFCPSEAARALSPARWRPLMPRVRHVAARLQRDGLLRVTQGGRAVDPLSSRGPIRLSRPMH
ncbi:MAG: DUF3253 domain-containing protein [Pseudomonadota bacterium]